ncbi:MAG: hypothetical protein AB7T49_19370 [Oligoflexales bacterium]
MTKRFITILTCVFIASQANAQSSVPFIQDNAVKIENLGAWPQEAYPVVANHKIIFMGEVHGIQEVPLGVSGLVKLLRSNNHQVTVGLGIWWTEQSRIEEYMKTGRADLLKKSPFFNSPKQDGRRSLALVQLLDSLRSMGDVKIACFDPVDGPGVNLGNPLRNAGMAYYLVKEATQNPNRTLVVLTGSPHSSVVEKKGGDGVSYFPAARMMTELQGSPFKQEDILSVMGRYFDGTAWLCKDTCGVQVLDPLTTNYSSALDWNSYLLKDSSTFDGHHSSFFVRHLSASPPYVQ